MEEPPEMTFTNERVIGNPYKCDAISGGKEEKPQDFYPFFLLLPVCVWENADLKTTLTVYIDSQPKSKFKVLPKIPKYHDLSYMR